jgi:hypothetical protein
VSAESSAVGIDRVANKKSNVIKNQRNKTLNVYIGFSVVKTGVGKV